jgi:VWFA-related protein
MQVGRKEAKIFYLFCLMVFFLSSGNQLFSQTTEKDRPKLKDFGSSLKRKKDQKTGNKDLQKTKSDEDSIKIKTDLVVSDVLVLDEKGNFVKGLTKEDFVITENGERQEIQMFSLGDDAKVPRSIVLLIDHSESELPFIVSSVMSAKILVDNLNPNDRVAIVTDNIELLCDFTRDKELLKKKLESLKIRLIMRNFGQSRQYSALVATLNELFSAEDIRPIVIFQTDGDQINLSAKPIDFNEVTTAIERSRTTIYSIFPGLRYEGLSENKKYKQSEEELKAISKRFNYRSDFDLNEKRPPPERKEIISHYEKYSKQQSVLAEVSESSGGWLEYLQTPVQAGEIYSKILEGINKRYMIGYYPKNETRDGKRRTLKIEAKNHPEYQIEGRKTYFAAEPEN